MSIDNEWLHFKDNQNSNIKSQVELSPSKEKNSPRKAPECSDIYISTQTKIAYLNQKIDLYKVFWLLPVIDYFSPKNGIIKKSIKTNSNSQEETDILDKIISNQKNVFVTKLSYIKNSKKFKDVKKIDIGLCEKDIVSYRKKKKGAFYNCFALILRIFYKDRFREVHVKIFNTGKLEIPGIQYDELLTVTLDNLITIIQPFIDTKVSYNTDDVDTVLINSNFTCRYYLDRFKLFQKLKYDYNIQASYDPCSYPGIQCLFYYNLKNKEHDGVHIKGDEDDGGDDGKEGKEAKEGKEDKEGKDGKDGDEVKDGDEGDEVKDKKSGWRKISFMIFRTGSVLVVGNCNKYILNVTYEFIKKILKKEFNDIFVSINTTHKKKPSKKLRKKIIKLDIIDPDIVGPDIVGPDIVDSNIVDSDIVDSDIE